MKTTQECWQALIDGETLSNGPLLLKLNEGMLVTKDNVAAHYGFSSPEDWSIYTPPKWYDNIPDGGVLCWCWDYIERNKSRCVITSYKKTSIAPFMAENGNIYIRAEPLTKQEIQQLLDNAPEGEKE